MNTADLAAFIEVARFESFSLAAEKLHLTQPAVSKRVQNLEETLGVNLFDRVGRRVQLTEAGRALFLVRDNGY
jgi:DNA-binding transcriptional LysR family regulator